MNHNELRKQVTAILDQTDAGKRVGLNLSADNRSTHLQIAMDRAVAGRSNYHLIADNTFPGAGEPDGGTVSLNMDAVDDLTDEEILEKIAAAGRPDDGILADVAASVPKVVLSRDEDDGVWVLETQCSYTPDALHPTCTITVLREFRTDLSSVPRVFWSLLAPEELSLAAPLFHDFLYRVGGVVPAGQLDPVGAHVFTRAEVDAIFLELMTKSGVARWKRRAAYWAVRGLAKFAWKGGSGF